MKMVKFTCGADVAALDQLDPHEWMALSMPVKGVRFDAKTLEFLDSDKDGFIRTPEVKAAIAYLKGKNFDFDLLFRDAKDEAPSDDECVNCYRAHLLEFLQNFVTMDRLYGTNTRAIFQTGSLLIDARRMNVCVAVDDAEAHSALAAASKCCLIYANLVRGEEKRGICAVVTAGRLDGLYVGRNGVFYDEDGKDWNATVTKVVESQISLVEAFWAPWKKLGEAIGGMVKKFLGDRQAKVTDAMSAGQLPPEAKETTSGNGAAMASSVAAIGIGIGMVGAAFASVMAVVSRMGWHEIVIAVLVVIAIVSLPSVILTWFKLRQRDLGAILNASGWAINRPMRFSQRLAKTFTR